MKKYFSHLFLPLFWTIFIQVLFCLPGSTLPETGGLFAIPNFDKYVHIIIFGVLVGLWCYYYSTRVTSTKKLQIIFFVIFLLAAANGIIVEYVQKNFIPNRSFDQGDIIADLMSSAIAYGICNIKLIG